jgi:hypothetical protein
VLSFQNEPIIARKIHAAPYFALECFLSILIRYRRVYGMVVFSEFRGPFCVRSIPKETGGDIA